MDLEHAIKVLFSGARGDAFERVRLAAEMGVPEALGALGAVYYTGIGGPPDGELARALLAEAAALGDALAAHNLGTLYATGAPPVLHNPHKSRAFHALARSRDPQLGIPSTGG